MAPEEKAKLKRNLVGELNKDLQEAKQQLWQTLIAVDGIAM